MRENDMVLIKQAQEGSPGAFEELYKKHRRRAYAVCLKITHDPVQAEDLTQDAFLQLYRKIQTFRGESQFTTWFQRLVINVALMHLRTRKNRRLLSFEQLLEERDGELQRHMVFQDTHLGMCVEMSELTKALARLAPGYRTILYLHDAQGYEHREIAGLIGRTEGNSKSQLHKARRKLRSLIDPAI